MTESVNVTNSELDSYYKVHVHATVQKFGFPSPKQAQLEALSCALNGRDSVILGATGLGRTMVPLSLADLTPNHLHILVVPTLELMRDISQKAKRADGILYLVMSSLPSRYCAPQMSVTGALPCRPIFSPRTPRSG